MAVTNEELDTRFTYHKPGPGELPKYEELRKAGRAYAGLIVTLTPESREQALALTHLEIASFYASAAVARRSNVAGAQEPAP